MEVECTGLIVKTKTPEEDGSARALSEEVTGCGSRKRTPGVMLSPLEVLWK